jgi:hypothetical protein
MQCTPLKIEQGIFALVSGNFHEAIRELLVVSREHVGRLRNPVPNALYDEHGNAAGSSFASRPRPMRQTHLIPRRGPARLA